MTANELIGRSVTAKIGSYDETATVTAVNRWEKDGMVRDYIEVTRNRGIGKLFLIVEGKARADFFIDTPLGKVGGFYGHFCNSGTKQAYAREMAEALFA